MKTNKKYKQEIFNVIKEIHSYDCFEFAKYEITSTSKEYLKWIDKEIK